MLVIFLVKRFEYYVFFCGWDWFVVVGDINMYLFFVLVVMDMDVIGFSVIVYCIGVEIIYYVY